MFYPTVQLFLRCKTMTIALNFQLQQNIEKLPAIIKQAKAVENNELLSLAYFLLSRCYASLGKVQEAIKFIITSWYYIKKVIENEVSSYLNTEKHVKLIEVYKRTVEIRMQLLGHQFKAGQQNISSFRNDTLPIDFFIIEDQKFLDEQLAYHYVCNMFMKLSDIGDFIESKIMLEKLHRQIRGILKRENLQFYDGKMDYNSLNSLFVTANMTTAENIVAEIGRLIEN